MSLLLDQRLVGEVAEYCPEEFLKYYQCLGQGDASACLELQKKLSKCARSTAPSFIRIVANCGGEMDRYETCIKENADFRSKCFSFLEEVRKCTEKAVGA